jgi:hypothetical protein
MTTKHKHDNPILVTGAAGVVGGIGRNLTELLLVRRARNGTRNMNEERGAYDPETVNLLRSVLDQAWNSLSPLQRDQTTKADMTLRILKLALAGERDPARAAPGLAGRGRVRRLPDERNSAAWEGNSGHRSRFHELQPVVTHRVGRDRESPNASNADREAHRQNFSDYTHVRTPHPTVEIQPCNTTN